MSLSYIIWLLIQFIQFSGIAWYLQYKYCSIFL